MDPMSLLEPGNIDLSKRARVRNPDGSISTLRSMSFEDNGIEVLVPTIGPDGRQLTQDQAINLYYKTGKHLGKFRSAQDATEFSKMLSNRMTDVARGEIIQTKAAGGAVRDVSMTEAELLEGAIPVEEEALLAGAQPVELPSEEQPEPSVLERLGKGAVGSAEMLGSLASGAIAAPVAGLLGLSSSVFGGADRAANLVRSYQEGLTYEPRTEAGQAQLGLVASPFTWLGERSRQAGEVVQEVTGSPGLATETEVALQMLPAAVGKGVRPAVAQAKQQAARVAAARAQQLEGLRAAKEAGYAVSPNEAQAGAIGRTVESLAGEPKATKLLSRRNQELTNRLAAKDVGLPEDMPISREALQKVRSEAGQDYETVKGIGRIKSDPQYKADLAKINQSYETSAADFAHRGESPIRKTMEGLKIDEFNATSAVEEVKLLRSDADKAFRQGDQSLGRALRSAAQAIDDQLARTVVDRATVGQIAPDAAERYLNARKRIAKSHMAEDALNEATGNIDASLYAKAFEGGKPLSGPSATIGRVAAQFPKSTRLAEKLGATGGTIFDIGLGLGAGGIGLGAGAVPGAGAAAAGMLARPAGRALLASKLGQRLLVRPGKALPSWVKPVDIATMSPELLAIMPGLKRPEERSFEELSGALDSLQ